MKILNLELYKYKRFSLNQIERFKIYLTEPLQLILGTNGSGKSSLIEQLNPLPPNSSDFSSGGYKILNVEHNNNSYKISSVFEKNQKHSFIVNGEELNCGNTITIQRDLVKEHFNITNDIIELILGKEDFIKMSPSKRKDWFIKLSDANYEYALKVYNYFKDKHRDILGAIKVAKKQIATETEKTLKTSEEEKLIKEKNYLLNVINTLLELRKPIELNIKNLENNNDLIDIKINRFKLEFEELKLFLNNSKDNLITIEDKLTIINSDINVYSDRINQVLNYINELDKKIEILKKADNNSILDLDTEIINLTNNKSSLINNSLIKKEIFIDYDNFYEIKSSLLDIFANIPDNSNKIYSSELLINKKEQYDYLIINRDKKLLELKHFETKLEHILEHKEKKDTTCPKCNHAFSLNYSESLEKTYKDTIDSYITQLDEINKQIDLLNEYLIECNKYSDYYKQYIRLSKTNYIYNDYFNYLNDLKIVSCKASQGIHEVNKIEMDISIQKQIMLINEKLNSLSRLKKQLLEVGESNLKLLLEDRENKEKDLNVITEELNNKKINKGILTESKKRYLKLESMLDDLKNLIKEKKTITDNLVETNRRQIFNDLIKELQLELSLRENTLNNLNISKLNLNNINNTIKTLEEQELHLNIILNNLSPTDGLIAEGLYNFINYFVSEMNHFISKIWSYDLIINPCSLDINSETGLDYKFPVTVNNNNTISDVSKGSSGIKEIINTAFKITALKHLKLLNYPFYLDEFGYSFDDNHKANSVLIIKSLLEQNIFNQLFLISHDYGQYGGLSNCEICVLDNENLNMPSLSNKVNNHVKIERV